MGLSHAKYLVDFIIKPPFLKSPRVVTKVPSVLSPLSGAGGMQRTLQQRLISRHLAPLTSCHHSDLDIYFPQEDQKQCGNNHVLPGQSISFAMLTGEILCFVFLCLSISWNFFLVLWKEPQHREARLEHQSGFGAGPKAKAQCIHSHLCTGDQVRMMGRVPDNGQNTPLSVFTEDSARGNELKSQ